VAIYNDAARKRIDATVQRVEQTPEEIVGFNPYDGAGPSQRPASFRNDSGETIPAYGCMKLTSGDKYSSGPPVPFFVASKPGSTLLTDRFAMNGPRPISSGGFGQCYLSGQVKALYNTGSPAAGDSYGPTPGEWYLTKDYPPIFRVAVISDSTPLHVYGELHPIELLRGELKDAMPTSGSVAAGQTATAYFLDEAGDIVTAIEFEVTDVFGVYRGRENGKYSDPHDRGSQLYAKFAPDSGVWEIQKMTPNALMIRGQLTEDLEKATNSFEIDNVVVMQPSGAIITDQDPASSTFGVTNRAFDGDELAEVVAVWDEEALDWKAIDIPCPE
jgi:hypothetical protein